MLDAHIVKRRRSFVIDVALHVPPRATIALFGASGSGKSTVLSCLAGFEEPDDGFIRINGEQLFPPPLPLYLRSIGYMTQDADLFPHLTVAQNVQFGIGPSEADTAWVAELRDRLGLEHIWAALAPSVSGGQARRVALARMLARRPALVLLDEPFAGLDRHIVRALVDDLTQRQSFWRKAARCRAARGTTCGKRRQRRC